MKTKVPKVLKISRTFCRDVIRQEEVCDLELTEDRRALLIKPPYDPDYGTSPVVTLKVAEIDLFINNLVQLKKEMQP